MTTVDEARRLALALPESVEQDHHGKPSFRVRGKIFATMPGIGQLNVMLEDDAVDAAVTENPDSCAELWWGHRLCGVRVSLATAESALVGELLADAWRCKAPKSLAQ